jgi:hypothetical protein
VSADFCETRRSVERSETKPSGALLFGYFILGTQEKVARRAGAEPRIKIAAGGRILNLSVSEQ